MREELKKIKDVRKVFRGVFAGFGRRKRGQELMWTLVLRDITDRDGNLLTDHIWFNLSKSFDKLNLRPGDRVEFSARVVEYAKGYKATVKNKDNIDYKLDGVIGIKKICGDVERSEKYK